LLQPSQCHHTHRPPSIELAVFNQSPFSDVTWTTTGASSRDILKRLSGGDTC
jgi:hypothetical protein